jgi:hypothetical protein
LNLKGTAGRKKVETQSRRASCRPVFGSLFVAVVRVEYARKGFGSIGGRKLAR